jgi:hypothetical protein
MYKIIVQGKLDKTLFDRLEGMTICETMDENKTKPTILEGELSDQAALAGVLNLLYELHMVILLVVCLNCSE